MSDERFENVSVIKKANIYFDGKVTSRTVLFSNGERKTLGMMLAGDYEFNTGASEVMEVLAGDMKVLLPNCTEWKLYKTGESYQVPANASFQLKVDSFVDYCCSYLE